MTLQAFGERESWHIFQEIAIVEAQETGYKFRARWMSRQDVENLILFGEILVTFNCWTLHDDEGIHFVYDAGGSPCGALQGSACLVTVPWLWP